MAETLIEDHDIEMKQAETPGRRREYVVLSVVSTIVIVLALIFGIKLFIGDQTTQSPLIGEQAPAFNLQVWGSSNSVSISSLHGKPVVLNLWASWCIPCRQEAPALESAWQQYQSQGVEFIGVDVQDTQQAGQQFISENGITYPIVTDADGHLSINYGMTGVPETYFISPSGRIVGKIAGPLDAQSISTSMQQLLKST